MSSILSASLPARNGKIFIHSRDDRSDALRERGATEPIEPRLTGLDLHHAQSRARGRGEDGFNFGDLQRSCSGTLRGKRLPACEQPRKRRPLRQLTEKVAPVLHELRHYVRAVAVS